jgi:YHS domain-containing protein
MRTNRWISLAAMAALLPLGLAQGSESKTEEPKPYPLKTCVVSGEKLGEMGSPHVFTYQGREIKLCCKGCVKDFNKEPAKYIKKLDEAEKTAKDGQKTGAPAHDHGGHQH